MFTKELEEKNKILEEQWNKGCTAMLMVKELKAVNR